MAVNYSDYWKEIDDLAEWISDNRPKDLGGEGVASEYGEGYDAHDALNETLDGHEYVIYTAQSRAIIAHSENANALMEEYGTDAGGPNFDTRRAYCAMYADILERAEFEKYDLDELRAERFEEMTQGEDFAKWVHGIVAGVTVPRWSSETVEITETYGEIALDLRWMPNNSHPRPIVRVSDEEWNEAEIRYPARL